MTGFWGDGGPYAAWVAFLGAWRAGEDADPGALPSLADHALDADTLARLGDHLVDAVNGRLEDWARDLGAAFRYAGDPFSFGRTLAQSRTALRGLRAVAAHPGLPPALRDRLTALVDEQITAVQGEFESALDEKLRDGESADQVEAVRRLLRDNAFTAVLAAPPGPPGPGGPAKARLLGRRRGPEPPAAPADPWAGGPGGPGGPPRRRIVTD